MIDLWCGYDEDSIQVVFSATNGATAACANLLIQRGLLDLAAPVIDYWPGYGVNGKDKTLVRWILSHKAGVLAPEPGLTMAFGYTTTRMRLGADSAHDARVTALVRAVYASLD